MTDRYKAALYISGQASNLQNEANLLDSSSFVAARGRTNCSQMDNEVQIPWITWPGLMLREGAPGGHARCLPPLWHTLHPSTAPP